MKGTLIQAIGSKHFSLLELMTEGSADFKLLEEISLQKSDNSNRFKIIERATYEKLTRIAENQLDEAIAQIITLNEKRMIEFLNNAPPINIRLHSLQLIKGIGPMARNKIMKSRKEKEFVTFEDFAERTRISDVQKLLKERIFLEITADNERYYLFARRPAKKREEPFKKRKKSFR